jgi:hypothetical protein
MALKIDTILLRRVLGQWPPKAGPYVAAQRILGSLAGAFFIGPMMGWTPTLAITHDCEPGRLPVARSFHAGPLTCEVR